MANSSDEHRAAISSNSGNDALEFNIAKWVIGFSFTVIGVLGLTAILAIAFGTGAKATEIKDILSILLPVIGAWAGTVIAYYFSRDNFESAARHTRELVTQINPEKKLESILVGDTMIPIEKAVAYTINKDVADIKIKKELVDSLIVAKEKNRIPVLNSNKHIVYILHRSVLDQYLVKAVSAGNNLPDISLKDLVEDPDIKLIVEAFAVLPRDATMAEAKALLDKMPNCSDIFITENGEKDTEVIGWLTNVLLLSYLKI